MVHGHSGLRFDLHVGGAGWPRRRRLGRHEVLGLRLDLVERRYALDLLEEGHGDNEFVRARSRTERERARRARFVLSKEVAGEEHVDVGWAVARCWRSRSGFL